MFACRKKNTSQLPLYLKSMLALMTDKFSSIYIPSTVEIRRTTVPPTSPRRKPLKVAVMFKSLICMIIS